MFRLEEVEPLHDWLVNPLPWPYVALNVASVHPMVRVGEHDFAVFPCKELVWHELIPGNLVVS